MTVKRIGEKAMNRINKQESPIIRLTRWQAEMTLPQKASNDPPADGNWTIFGVDAEGNERVYVQVPSQQFEKWSKTDPLWSKAQAAIFQRLLSDPSTRDTLIKINIQAALEKGDEETAMKLWNALSQSTKATLMTKPEA